MKDKKKPSPDQEEGFFLCAHFHPLPGGERERARNHGILDDRIGHQLRKVQDLQAALLFLPNLCGGQVQI